MHIALLSPGWPPERTPNGIATYVGHMQRELHSQGHRVSVFCGADRGGGSESGVYPVGPNWWRRGMRRLARLSDEDAILRHGEVIADAVAAVHRRDPIDVLEMEESFGWCAAVQRRFKFPVVAKLHGPAFLTQLEDEPWSRLSRARLLAEGEALKAMRFITAPSVTTLRSTIERYALTPIESQVVVNPMASDADWPAWNPLKTQSKDVLFVGRFDKLKGADFLLQAYVHLHAQDSAIRLTFVGPDVGVVEADGKRIGIYDFLAKRLTPSQRNGVTYLGALQRNEIPPLRCRAAAVVVCSRWENQPNSALEAMLQACPVVASDVGGMSEVIDHERTGLLYQSGDIDSFCTQVRRLADDPGLGARLGSEARRHVLRAHSPQVVVADTLRLYEAFRVRRSKQLGHTT